jgi:histidinol dehydrogenase
MIAIYKNSDLKGEVRNKIFRRAQADIDSTYNDVKFWIDKIKKEGNSSILKYIKKFDNPNFTIDQFRVSKEDIKRAYEKIDPKNFRNNKKTNFYF